VFMWSMAVFTGASLGCALSPNFAALIAFRALQGVGGGAIPAVGMAIVPEIFPRDQHGRAISTWGTAALLSPAFGPTFGGWLVSAFTWHWLFLINVPIGAFALVVSPRLLPDLAPREHHPFDFASLLLGAAALSLTVLALSNGASGAGARLGRRAPASPACCCSGGSYAGTFAAPTHCWNSGCCETARSRRR
jgi:DHA2 family multidrug resistance protein